MDLNSFNSSLCQFCGQCATAPSEVAAVAVTSTLLLRLTHHCLRMPAARSCQLRLAIMRRDFVDIYLVLFP